MDFSVGEWFGHPQVGPVLVRHIAATMTEEQQAAAAEHQDMLKMIESLPMHQFLSPLGVQLSEEAVQDRAEPEAPVNTASRLRVDHLGETLGTGVTRPCLSWWPPAGSAHQLAHRIRTQDWDSAGSRATGACWFPTPGRNRPPVSG
ncbi:hypothetical protein [Nonomuraea bangladeshensis]|uniref:hypothetical protein n=1 Tax=Nonomuraea bangladeshensis TaxID=404385 RepID=UPI003C2E896A